MASEDVDISKSYEYKLGDKSIVVGNVLQANNSGRIDTYITNLKQDDNDDDKNSPIDLSMIDDKEMFAALMRLISEEDLSDLDDLTPDYFKWIFQAASYLCLDQELLTRFARNIFKKAFLGKHANDIIRTFPDNSPSIGENISWAIFLAFLDNSGYYIKRDEDPDTITVIPISRPRTEGHESETTYRSKPRANKLSLILDNHFGVKSINQDNRMAFLFWFIYQLKIKSFKFDDKTDIKRNDIIRLTDVIRDAKKLAEDEDMPFSLELCELHFWKNENDKAFLDSLQELRNLHPKLNSIGLMAPNKTLDETKLFSGLKKLYLHGYFVAPEQIKMLLYDNPHLIELSIIAYLLTEDCAEWFGTCESLKILSIYGRHNDSRFINALISQIPGIVELTLDEEKLEDNVGLKFKDCPNIEKLFFKGSRQGSKFIANLVNSIPSIKRLSLCAGTLDQNAAKAFETCKKLKSLEIDDP